MYLKDDLDVKSFEELLSLAKEMGIKKPESMSKKDLVFKIIDEQAVQSDETPKLRKRRRTSGSGRPARGGSCRDAAQA